MQRRNFLPAVVASVWAVTRHPLKRPTDIPEEAKTTWLTQHGEDIRICDMSDEHLRNCIFYLVNLRALSSRHCHTHLFNKQGEITWVPQFEIMLREATRRKLAWS